jgi:LmbE family N-acetylglucosaminyl deacetylase
MANFLFLHAHPDDEAIFTGGIIRKLADDGHNIYVTFATGGELGNNVHVSKQTRELRFEESENARKILGVKEITFLGYHDSGLDPKDFPENAFANCDIEVASSKLLEYISLHDIDTLVCDDEYGIYGHPDHVQAHKVGVSAFEKTNLKELYFTTVDREYLHFVETHLVEEASLSTSTLDLAKSTIGMSSVEITHTIDVNSVLDIKRKAMAAHASQINDTSSALVLDDDQFKAVYGYEWFLSSAGLSFSKYSL